MSTFGLHPQFQLRRLVPQGLAVVLQPLGRQGSVHAVRRGVGNLAT